MKCKHCNSEWSVAAELASKMVTCPFCGKPLVTEKKKELDSIEAVLQEITRLQGQDVLANGSQMTAYFTDIAPKLVRERRLLRAFTDCKGNQIILEARTAQVQDRRQYYEQAVLRMCEEYFIAENAARMMCGAFYQAVFGEAVEEPPVPSPKKQPETPIQSQKKQPVQPPKKKPAPPPEDPVSKLPAETIFRYGKVYENGGMLNGQDVKPDLDLAIKYYEMAAQKGSAGAIGALLRLFGSGQRKDDHKYFHWAKLLSDRDVPVGLLSLARCYKNGTGTQKDYAKALQLFQKVVSIGGDKAIADIARQEMDSMSTAGSGAFECSGTILTRYKGTAPQVQVPDGITEIGAYAFSGVGVRQVKLPDTVRRIGMSAFQNCKNLRSITLPDNISHIEARAFSGCPQLLKVTLPNKLDILGMQAFANCMGLMEVTLPGRIREVNASTFQGCNGLLGITLGEGIQYIGKNAFAGCSALEWVRVPNSLQQIDEHAFDGCPVAVQVYASANWRLTNPLLMKRIVHK